MKILITGSGGRVGRAIIAALQPPYNSDNLPQQAIVTTLDCDPRAQPSWFGDVADKALLQRAMHGGVDAVIHTAALHAPHVSRINDVEFERVNVTATQTLIDVAIQSGVRRIIYTSTTALYGHANAEEGRAAWLTEHTVPKPKTIYHRTKLAAEQLLMEASTKHGIAVCALRMSRCFPETAAQMAVYRLHRGVDARDVAQAHVLALNANTQGFNVFIISGRTPFLAEDCEALYADAPSVMARGAPALVAEFKRRGWPLPKSIDRVYDASHALKVLGWQSKFGFEEVLKQADARSAEVL